MKSAVATTAINQALNQCCGSGSEIRCLFDPWIRDPGWGKNPDPGSGMHNPDQISDSLETIFWVKGAQA
jgi:hypothetical protein